MFLFECVAVCGFEPPVNGRNSWCYEVERLVLQIKEWETSRDTGYSRDFEVPAG